MENHTAKHFVLPLGSLASLYLSLSFLLALVFGITNIMFPDAADTSWQIDSAHNSVRIGIAMVLVFFPTYLLLTRTVNKLRRQAVSDTYLVLTKWLVYLSLLVGGAVLLGDLVAVIITFLEGEITQRFLIKAASVFLVIGAAFHYYILDARGYWLKHEDKSIRFAIGAIVVVLVALAYGIANIETPTQVREQKIDDAQLDDLGQIQFRIQNYYVTHQALPENLSDLGEPAVPNAPEGRAEYRYNITDEGFALCATFAEPSNSDSWVGAITMMEKSLIRNPDDWQHGAGEVCFERVIN
jgi:glucan phosphoethanolaminetransferase (alkaline phosphatase superfamily)